MISLSSKRLLVFALVFAIVASYTTLAIAQETSVLEEETADISNEDLELEHAGILPTNPFYFFKEFTRGVQRLFILDKVERAEFELKVVNEKAAEINAIDEVKSDDNKALDRAVENYSSSVDRLRVRLEELSEDSENPNIDRLLDELTERSLRHHQLLDELRDRHIDLKDRIEGAQTNLDRTIDKTIDSEEKLQALKERIEKLISEDSSPRKIIQAILLIDRIAAHTDSEEVKSELRELRARLANLLRENSEEAGVPVDRVIDRWPAGDDVRLRLINDVQDGAPDELRTRLDHLRIRVKDNIDDGLSNRRGTTEICRGDDECEEGYTCDNGICESTDVAQRELEECVEEHDSFDGAGGFTFEASDEIDCDFYRAEFPEKFPLLD